ncbi:MAG: hypothetical protein KGZ49_06070 [Syntrophaceae bacterium]|nr:hypothetical protein [Syntrophaceae bacterium]
MKSEVIGKSSFKTISDIRLETRKIIENYGRDKDYDALITFSGGKDSTYALYLAKEVIGLDILAVTMDNWLMPDVTKRNILSTLERIGVDHLTYTYNWDNWKKFYSVFLLKSGMMPRSICWVCNIVLMKIVYETLQKYKIPLWITGNTGAENSIISDWIEKLKIKEGIKESKNSNFIEIENLNFNYWTIWRRGFEKLLRHVLDQEGENIIEKMLFPRPNLGDNALRTFGFQLLKLIDYDVKNAMETIQKELGWLFPENLAGTQNDCLGMELNVYLYKEIYGEKNYDIKIRKVIEEGGMPEIILKRALNISSYDNAKNILKKLDLSDVRISPELCDDFLKEWIGLLKPVK